jgi:hypothetical protein
MDDLFGPLIFIVIMVIGLLSKLKKTNEEAPRPPGEMPDLDLPEILRRALTGEGPVPKARPAPPRDSDDDGWRPVPPITIQPPQRRETPYQPPVARPTLQRAPEAAPPPRPRPPIVVEAPTSRPTAKTVPKLVRTPPATPASPRTRAATLSPVRSLRSMAAPQPAAKAKKTAPAPPAPQPAHAHALLRNLEDARRGIILSEVLGPPLSLR